MAEYEGMNWQWGPYDLPSEGGFDVGDLLSAAQSSMEQIGFSNVKTGGAEWWVCGSNGATVMVVIYLSAGGYSFTQIVVAGAAGSSSSTETTAAQDVAAFEKAMKDVAWL
jgi:hypothetical protein